MLDSLIKNKRGDLDLRKISFLVLGLFVLIGFVYLVSALQEITTVTLNATSGDNLTSDNLTATVSPLNLSQSYLYDWYKDNVLSAVFLGDGASQNTIPSSFTTVGEVWYVNATPKVLTNNYNISNASLVDNLSVSAQDTNPRGMAFNNDGTKVYVVGVANGDIYEYNLSTPFDVSTGVNVSSFNVSAQETFPQGMAFNNDGTKLYVIGSNGDAVYEYNLSTAFDISTGVFNDNFSVSSEDTGPAGMAFNNDGTKLYVVGNQGDAIFEYNLSTAFDISTGVFNDNLSFSVGSDLTGMAFNNDGTKVYVLDSDDLTIEEYNLSTAFDVSTGVLVDSLDITAQDNLPNGMAFNNDGTKVYMIGSVNDFIHEYDVGSVVNGVTVQSNNLTIIPGISNVTLNATSINNLTTDNLTATVSGLSPSSASILYDWYKDGLLSAVFLGNVTFQNTIPSWFTTVGETWQVNVTPKVLTNNYNVSTGVNVSIFSVLAQDDAPHGMAFNNDGTKVYVVGTFNNGDIYEYNLSTAFDVSTGVFVDSLSVTAQEPLPRGMAFNNDGTKLYVIGTFNNGDIYEYNLSTAFNVSTAVNVSSLDVSAQETFPTGMVFNNDGTKLYVVGADGIDITEYNLSTPFDVSTGVNVSSLNVSAQDTIPHGMAFNNDGTKVYVIGQTSDAIHEYNLSTPFDVSTGVNVSSFDVSAQEVAPRGMAFNNDGTKLYIIGSTNDSIHEYDVGSVVNGVTLQSNNLTINAINISSVVLNATSINNLTTDNLTATVSGLFPSSASVLYDWYKDNVLSAVFLGNSTFQNTIPNWFTTVGEVWQVNATPKVLTNNYNVSNASFVANLSVSAQTQPFGMAFNNDGTKLYVVGDIGDAIYEYNLSTAFDISTGTFVDFFNVSAQDTFPADLAFNNDGTKLYVLGLANDDVYEYNLSTAFDVSTRVNVSSLNVSAQDTAPNGMAFNNDGTKLYVIGLNGDAIYEYNLSTAFDVSTGVFVDSLSVLAQDTFPADLAFNNDGTKLYVVGFANDEVYEYNLSTAFDVSTGVFVDSLSVSAQDTSPQGIVFNNDGTKLYVVGFANDEVYEYDVGSVVNGVTLQSNSLAILADTTSPSGSTTPTPGGGGGGGGCASGYILENGICVQVEEEVESGLIPSQLFDITFTLDDSVISNSDELSSVVTFESFGTEPTPVDLVFIILDSSGNEIYREESDVTIITEEVLRWNYETLQNLPKGKYTAVLETLYNVDVFDEFRQEFEIAKKRRGITGRAIDWIGGKINLWVILAILLLGLLAWLIWWLLTRKKRKERGITEFGRARVLKRGYGQTGETDIGHDQKVRALLPGKRISKKGKIYYERRMDHSDVHGKKSTNKWKGTK